MSLLSLSRDVIEDILEILTLEESIKLSRVCSKLHSAVQEDRHLWHSFLKRCTNNKLEFLQKDGIPIEDVSVEILRTWAVHVYVLKKAYQNPSMSRAVVRIDTPARVTFVKLVRAKWFIVASSDTSISELSVWEILSTTSCSLRNRVYFPAPVLDGILDDGGSYIRIAVTVGTCCPSIRILELAKSSNDEILLVQRTEIADSSRVLFLKESMLFFACKEGDDTWPTMMNWMHGSMVRLSYTGGGSRGEPFPLTLEYCSGLYIWRSFIMLFAYSGLHIFKFLEPTPASYMNSSPTLSLDLPRQVFRVNFLDEYDSVDASGRTITSVRWVAHLADSESAILVLTYTNGEDSNPQFKIDIQLNPGISNENSDYHFAIESAIGKAGNYMVFTSVDTNKYTKAPSYKIIPIRPPGALSRTIRDGGTHLSVEEPMIIPRDGLPYSSSVSCLDFDDSHGILLIGSDAGQFCLVNFANVLLTSEAFVGGLPIANPAGETNIQKIPLDMDIPTYYSYYTLPEYMVEERPACIVDDSIRLWGDASANHARIPGWSSDWSRFLFAKEWVLPLSLWGEHDFAPRVELAGHRIRTRLQSYGEITPILYDERNHARVILRMGNRVLYCRTILYDEDDEHSSQLDILGALSMTYVNFSSADLDVILAHINDHDSQRNLEDRSAHAIVVWKEYSSRLLAFARKEAARNGKVFDERKLDEWTEDEREKLENTIV